MSLSTLITIIKSKLSAAAAMVDTSPRNRHIPAEILEQILSNLPIKSLLRFSAVATSWNSTIAKLERSKSNNRMVVINDNPSYFGVADASYAPLPPSLSPITAIAKAKYPNFVSPFRADVKVKAVSDKLWCVAAKKSMYLYNPSTGACKKLSDAPSLYFWHSMRVVHWNVAYGLGYDAVEHDYKLLKICRSGKEYNRTDYKLDNSFIYSLKNDSWTEIRSRFPGSFPDTNGLFVDTTLNWMVMNSINWREYVRTLVSFDFSTHKFRVLEQPMYSPEPIWKQDVVDVAVLGGKLCVFLNYMRTFRETALVER